jgi:glycogen synthase
MLGSGDPAFEGWMRSTESSYKDKFRGWVGFSVPVSHRITAGYAKHRSMRTFYKFIDMLYYI